MGNFLKQNTISILFWLIFSSTSCFGVSTYMGLQPGRSSKNEVEKIFGQPIRSIGTNMFEYALPKVSVKIYVEFRANDYIVERIERRFEKPVSRAAIIRSLNLPENPEEKGTLKEGNLVEYFGDIKTLALTYASAESGSGVISIGYYSMELFERSLEKARNPLVQFDPASCRDLYYWAQAEQDVAKRSKNVSRRQAILEISILSQRGECEKARSLAATYKERFIK